MEFSGNERRLVAQQLGLVLRDDRSSHKGMIDDALVEGVAFLVDQSGVLGKFAEWHKAERKGPGGRPAVYGDHRDRLILVLMLVLLRMGRPPQLIEITDAIRNRLSVRARRELRLPADNGHASDRALYDRVQGAWKRFVRVCDPMPGPTHRRKLRSEVEALKAAIDPEDSCIKRKRLHWVMNALLEVTWQLLEEDTRAQWCGNLAMDTTAMFVWGKRGQNSLNKRPSDRMSPEFHADWHWMNGDPLKWAYSVHIAVTAPAPYEESKHPLLAIAASMDTPGRDLGKNFTSMLRSVVQRGHPRGYAIADRGIFGHAKPEDLNRPVIELGYKPVIDYRKDQVGFVQGVQRGAIYVAGSPMCPATPQNLISAETKYAENHDYETFREQITQRDLYRFRRKDGDAWFCPAMGPGATASCKLRPNGPLSVGMPTSREHAVIRDHPAFDERPDCCKNGQVSLPAYGTAAEKYLQPVPYRSQKWEDIYDMRTLVESFNGYTKDSKNESLEDPVSRRVRGFAANALVAVGCLVASNLRKITAFFKSGNAPISVPRPRPPKRGFTRVPGWVAYGKRRQYGEPRRRDNDPPGQPEPDVA